MEEIENGSTAIEGFVTIRPSLLTDGRSIGFGAVRAAMESQGKIDKSAIGYTVSRADVGGWIFEALVEDKAGERSKYLNPFVGITA